MRRNAGLLAVAGLWLGSAASLPAEDKETSAEWFNAYANSFSTFSPMAAKDWAPALKRDGFCCGEVLWKKSDSAGTVSIWFVPVTPGSPAQLKAVYEVVYTPTAPAVLGQSVLAALIGKAEKVDLGNGDSLVITVAVKTITYPDSNMSADASVPRRAGTRSESLKFNLRDGRWQETSVSIAWK